MKVNLGLLSGVSPLTGSLPGQCDFDSGLCGYFQDVKEDKADWLRVRGHTPTSYTGPKGDHTTGVGELFSHSVQKD